MKKGPYPVLYDRTNTERITEIEFGGIRPGYPSQEVVVWLWNKRNFSDAPTMTDVRLNVIETNFYGETVINADAVKVKSNGISDPDGVGIIDDSEDSFYTIGGDLTDSDTYHAIGDIPSNCARRLWFRIDLPAEFTSGGSPILKIQVGFMSEGVKWLYADE